MRYIDLRSDTETMPTSAMLESILAARLGDDILGEDPTVIELEALGAKLFGKEAALLTVSGTQANQIAVMALTERGQEVIVGDRSHIYNLEVAGMACLSQVLPRPITCPRGYFDPEVVAASIREPGIQAAHTGLICLENTYDLNRGYIMDPANIDAIGDLGREAGVPVYMDGARILNAAVAGGREVAALVKKVDAVQICLTKGLAAPIGSLLMGTAEFVARARWMRQRIGGGMRQAGVIAAPALVALRTMVARLADDHANAAYLTQRLRDLDAGLIDPDDVQTNIVTIDVAHLNIAAPAVLDGMVARGIRIKQVGPSNFRMICHHDLSRPDLDQALTALAEILNLPR